MVWARHGSANANQHRTVAPQCRSILVECRAIVRKAISSRLTNISELVLLLLLQDRLYLTEAKAQIGGFHLIVTLVSDSRIIPAFPTANPDGRYVTMRTSLKCVREYCGRKAATVCAKRTQIDRALTVVNSGVVTLGILF